MMLGSVAVQKENSNIPLIIYTVWNLKKEKKNNTITCKAERERDRIRDSIHSCTM